MSQLYAVKLADGSWWEAPISSHKTPYIDSDERKVRAELLFWQKQREFQAGLTNARVVPIRLEESSDDH